MQFVKFGLVGVSNTVVSLITYYIIVFLGGHYLFANAVGFVTGTLNAYFWNSHFVFRKETGTERNEKESLVKTFISYGFTFVLGSILLYIEVQLLGISDKIAPIINVCINTPINFCLNKLWVYAKKRGKE